MVFHCYFHQVLFLCVFFGRPFLVPPPPPATVISDLCRGSWGSWTRNTGTNRGRESGAEGHCLGFISENKPLFYSPLQMSFYPFSQVKWTRSPKPYQPVHPLLSHHDNSLSSRAETPKLCGFPTLRKALPAAYAFLALRGRETEHRRRCRWAQIFTKNKCWL